MKHLSGIWHKLAAVVAVTAALSSCNRAEYAMLPKTTSYHGTAHRATSVAAAETAAPATVPTAAPEAVAAPAPVVATPEKATAVAVAPQATVTEKASAPAAVATTKAAKVSKSKLSLVERVAVSKIAKRVDKVASKTLFNKHREAAKASRLEGKLRQAVILGLVGLLLEIIGAAIGGSVGGAFYIVGAVLLIVALVLLVIYLLDEI